MTDIFSILKADHDLHREMLEKIAETHGDTPERRDLFEAFRVEVTAHAAIVIRYYARRTGTAGGRQAFGRRA
jgi:hypothetical protein